VRPRWFNVATFLSIVLLIFVAIPGSVAFHSDGNNWINTGFGQINLSNAEADCWGIGMIVLMVIGVLLPPIWLVLWVIERFRSD
jgi:hypothetical protein